ncbi:MAG: hypothetical protein HOD92_18910 [Deltaproteobacteria bacterium]|jgi:hypothetical protein|nr:hypothetical protein [Deltaproteobacteria bacterium]MBT4528079.1 hypothetical protein [Deltaproteobacteria bacterium]
MPDNTKKIAPRTIFNLLSIIGFFLTLFGVLGEIFLFLISVFSTEFGAYQGIFVMLFFMLIILGLILIGFGYWLEKQRRKSGKELSFSEQSLLLYLPVSRLFCHCFSRSGNHYHWCWLL